MVPLFVSIVIVCMKFFTDCWLVFSLAPELLLIVLELLALESISIGCVLVELAALSNSSGLMGYGERLSNTNQNNAITTINIIATIICLFICLKS